MRTFSSYDFGCTDAYEEYSRNPKRFDAVFYDLSNCTKEIYERKAWLIIGRKGVGKSAIAQKIMADARKRNDFLVGLLDVAELWTSHHKLNMRFEDENALESRMLWTIVILCKLYDILSSHQAATQSGKELSGLMAQLRSYGFVHGGHVTITKMITTCIEKGIKLKVKAAQAGFGKKRETQETVADPATVRDVLVSSLARLGGVRGTVLLIDGMDPFLTLSNPPFDTVAAMVFACRELNQLFRRLNVPIVIVVLMRTEIVNGISHPEKNKLIQDSSKKLAWYRDPRDPMETDLMRMWRLRLASESPELAGDKDAWYKLFPREVHRKNSWQFVKECTLLRPRDLLALMRTIQDLYPNEPRLEEAQLLNALNNYSSGYFREELWDSLVGFLSFEQRQGLYKIFAGIGRFGFKLSDFTAEVRRMPCYAELRPEQLLDVIYDRGIVNCEDTRGFWKSSDYDDGVPLRYDETFRLNPGLFKAFNLA